MAMYRSPHFRKGGTSMNELGLFLQEEDGVAVIEIVLILLVLIALVVLFKTQITKTLKTLMTRVTNDSSAI
jgi:Flp pilus assembly pilin Flp